MKLVFCLRIFLLIVFIQSIDEIYGQLLGRLDLASYFLRKRVPTNSITYSTNTSLLSDEMNSKQNISQASLALALVEVGLGVKEKLSKLAYTIERNCNGLLLEKQWLDMFVKNRFIDFFKKNQEMGKELYFKKNVYYKRYQVLKQLLDDFVRCGYNESELKDVVVVTDYYKKRKFIVEQVHKDIEKLQFVHPKIIKRTLKFISLCFFKNKELIEFEKTNGKYQNTSFSEKFARYLTNFIIFLRKFKIHKETSY